MCKTRVFIRSVFKAILRAHMPILTVALTYILSISGGILMVQTGNQFALNYRDTVVGRANISDPASIAFNRGNRLLAALWDFAYNV